MNRSIIYCTTPTSGSQSIWRILHAIAGPDYVSLEMAPINGRKPTIADFPATGHLIMARGVHMFDRPIYDERFLYVGNFRDPRDMYCNQYHWLLQHPVGHADDPEARARAEAAVAERSALGIDASVLRHTDDSDFSHVCELADRQASGASNILFVSYAQLCCAYDVMIERLVTFLDTPLTDLARSVIAAEAPQALANNPLWIGNEWTGTDVMPGRYKRELQPETIAVMDSRFGAVLDRLADLDLDGLRSLYAHRA